MKAQNEIKMKDGSIIEKGSEFSYRFVNHKPLVTISDKEYHFSARGLAKLLGKKTPSMNCLEKWISEGYAKTITGHHVEPDGYGPDGSPSWFIALGLI